MKEMICTLHPEKKKGVNISMEKYEIISKAILITLNARKEMTFMDLSRAVEKQMNGTFEGSVMWDETSPKIYEKTNLRTNRVVRD